MDVGRAVTIAQSLSGMAAKTTHSTSRRREADRIMDTHLHHRKPPLVTLFLIAFVAVTSASDLHSAESDLWTNHSGPGAIATGSPFTVTVGYGNNGPEPATSAYVNSYFTAPMGLDVLIDDFFNGGGSIFDAVQASADGTDTLGNAPILFWDDYFCEDLLFQLQRSDGDTDADPVEGLDPGVSATFSYDVTIPMESPNTGTIEITEPASLAQAWTGSNPANVFSLQAAALNTYGRAGCDKLVGGDEEDVCEYIDDNCFGDRVSLLDQTIEADWELVDDGSPDPTLGCESLVDFTPGNIAVVRRGGCEFGVKAFNAELAGAAATIIVNTNQCSDLPVSDQCVINMGAGSLGGLITIPVVMFAQADGEPVIATIEGGETVHGAVGTATRFSAEGYVFLADTADIDPDENNDPSTWVQPVLGEICTYTLDPAGRDFPAGGGGGQIAVTTGDPCYWEASTAVPWILFPAGSGNTGSTTLWYQVLANTGPGRSAVIEITDQVHFVTQQAGNGCTYSIDPADDNFLGPGGYGSFEIVARQDCQWTASTTAPWLALTSSPTGTGSATLTYTVDPNTTTRRVGAVLVADKIHHISQDVLNGCDHGIVTDDGTPENGYGGSVGNTFVQLFAPGSYPFVITDVCAAFTRTAGGSTHAFDVLIFDDDGSPLGPGTLLGTAPSVIDEVPPWLDHTFASVDVEGAGVVINDGSVFIGVGWDLGNDSGVYVAADESTGTQMQTGFFGDLSFNWELMTSAYPDYRSLMVRVDGYSPVDGEWEQVVGSVFGGGNGFGDTGNAGAPTMASFQGGLFVGTRNHNGAEVRYTVDGQNWLPANDPGFGIVLNHAVSELIPFNGHLYASTLNSTNGTEVFRMTAPSSWTSAVAGGFGDPSNTSAPSASVFEGQLYLGTDNAGGCEIWRTTSGLMWTQVHTNGFGNPQNTVAESMAIFGGELHVGTRNADGAELWRSPDGVVWFPVMTGGFGSASNVAVSDLVVFDNALYAGLSNTVTGAQVWRSFDGATWAQVAGTGFGDPRNTEFHSFGTGDLGLHAAVSGASYPGTIWQSPHGAVWSVTSSPGFTDSDNEAVESLHFWGDRVHAGTSNPESGCEIWRGGRHRLFGDGFESGDTSVWAAVAP